MPSVGRRQARSGQFTVTPGDLRGLFDMRASLRRFRCRTRQPNAHHACFNQQGEETTPVRVAGSPGRSARKWFSFDLPVDPAHPMKLIATYHGEERATRTFEILVDGVRVGEQRIERHRPGSPTKSFFDVEYAIPADLVKGKQKVTVRFQATGGNETAGVFGVRVVRVEQ